MGNHQGAFETFCIVFNTLKHYLAIISLQFGYAGMYIITMICLKGGMSHWILVVYRHAVAIVAIAPFAYAFERKTRPKMTKSVLLKVLLLGFLEPVLDQNLYFLGMTYTSATFASAVVNILPAITFIMAVIFRLERVYLTKIPSVAKVIGTAITVGGAMLMTLYKGPIVNILWYQHAGDHHSAAAAASDQHWVTGTILLFCCIFSWAAFFIMQSITLREYPAELSLATLICVAGLFEGGIVAVIMERDIKAWAIGFDSRLLAAAYSGIVCSGIAYYVQSVVSKARGPVFVTAFSPLSMVITAVLGAMVLSEQVHLGSIIGAAIIVCGLYFVVWGKSKEGETSDAITTNEKGKANELPVVDKARSTVGDADETFVEPVLINKSVISQKKYSSTHEEP